MANLQVKGIDDALYEALAARAARDNRSISQEVVVMIQDFLSRPPNENRRAADQLLSLAGKWVDDRSAEEIVKDIYKARRNTRRPKI